MLDDVIAVDGRKASRKDSGTIMNRARFPALNIGTVE
jgi:hypothetical protein